MKNISFITPTYGIAGNTLTLTCVTSLRAHLGASPEVIVVIDGHPADNDKIKKDLVDKLKKLDVKILTLEKNGGFAKTCNVGLKESKGTIKVLLNNDTVFTHDILDNLIGSFADESIGIVGARLLYPNKTIQHGGIEHVNKHIFYHIDWHSHKDFAVQSNFKSFSIAVTGAFFAISKRCYDFLGGLDETFYMGFEDTSYCIKAWMSDFKVLYNPEIELIHDEGATRGSNDLEKASINPDGLATEKAKEKIFAKRIQALPIEKLKQHVDYLNDESKLKILEFMNSNALILCIRRVGAMGDVVLTTGVIKYLAETYPNIEIVILTACPSVFDKNPYISNVYTDGNKAIYDYVINLDLAYEVYPDRNIIESYCHKILGKDFDDFNNARSRLVPCLYHSKTKIKDLLKGLKIAVIHMAKTWESRTLGIKKWTKVSDYLISKGFCVAIVGGKNDLGPEDLSSIMDYRGQTTIQECKELIECSEIFLSVDSGLFHVASSTDTPIVGIFSCVDPMCRISREEKIAFVTPKSKCKFKLSKEKEIVTYHNCNNSILNECIKSIRVDDIIEAVESLV